MRAVIVASGPSARGFEPPSGVLTIAVNGAVKWLSRADHWFSLDASLDNQEHMLSRRLGCVYHTCGPHWGGNKGDVHWERISVVTRGTEPRPRGAPEWWFWRLNCVGGINRRAGQINTGNSAWGALGLAWHLGVTDVALIGVDASAEPRVEGGTSENLSHLPMLFATAVGSFERLVCLGAMKAPGIPQMTLEEWLC